MNYYSKDKEPFFEKKLNLKHTKIEKNKIIVLSDDILKKLKNTTNYFSGYKELFLNKYETFKSLVKNNINTVPTKLYTNSFITDKKIITKPIDGSGRIKYLIWEQGEEVLCKQNMIIQPFIEGREYNVDLLCDGKNFITCVKEKLQIKAGKTWKCKEVNISKIDLLLSNFVKKYPFYGSMDIDIIENNENYYILDINTRFGGGMMHSINLNTKFLNQLYNLINFENYKLVPYKKIKNKKISFYSFNINSVWDTQ